LNPRYFSRRKEALAILQEQAATPLQIDGALRGAGFRMGPCELMDLIGHDVNYSVTVSVFEANYGDRRYVPSQVQKELVDGGRLGRKAGKGFYETVPLFDALASSSNEAATGARRGLVISGRGKIVEALVRWATTCGISYTRDEAGDWRGLQIGPVRLHVTDGRTADHLAADLSSGNVAVMDLPLALKANAAIAIAFSSRVIPTQREQVMRTLQDWGLQPTEVHDVPGLIVGRTVAMLVNEAADAVHQGVCDAKDADTAMKLGTNYPAGPFEWLAEIGSAYVVDMLDNLFKAYRSERYRISPLVRKAYWTGAPGISVR
jgi:3-hydroxybutyryl-CoA dehydrogenase